jgi:hypothetical protein
MDMTFNRKLILILWVASCVVVGSAQDKKSSGQSRPDLTGTWVRSSYKSNHRGQLENYPVTLAISHKEPEVTITRKSVIQGKEKITDEVYYTDGRGEKNEPQFQTALAVSSSPTSGIVQKGADDPQTKTKTKWESKKLVSRSSTTLEAVGHRFYIDATQKRELSADGKTLTITTTIMPGGSAITEVFDRVQ